MDKRTRDCGLAVNLKSNTLLPELIDARAQEIREEWEAEQDPIKREQHWVELKALNDLKDFLYGRIDELSGREPTG